MTHILAALNTGKRRVLKAQGAHQHSRIVQWRGLSIGIENDIGSKRSGVDSDGHRWTTEMSVPYGEILGTLGVDDNPVDCFVYEDGLSTATHVYVIHTACPKTGRYDEDKAFIGFDSPGSAAACFANHYDDPQQHFGALVQIPTDTFVRRCLEPEHRGKSFSHDTEARVRLGRRRIIRAVAERADDVAWMQALVQKANAIRSVAKGLTYDEIEERIQALERRLSEMDKDDECNIDWDDVDHRPVIDYQLGLLRYAREANRQREVYKSVVMPGPDEDLYLRIYPGKNAVDLQGEIIPVDLIYKSWEYYLQCGNIDLEHISKTGGKSWREQAAKIEAAGFCSEWGAKMRVQYEIGRPVAGTLKIEAMDENGDVLDFSFVARIHAGDNEAARWFRSTLPDIPWKPSVGGQMSTPVRVMTQVSDPRLNIDRIQEVAVARDFRWNNVAMTLEPCNHWVEPVEILTPEEVEEVKRLEREAQERSHRA